MATEYERSTERPLERRPLARAGTAIVVAILATFATAALIYFTFADISRRPATTSTQPTVSTAPERALPTAPSSNSTTPTPTTK
jgi:hypothetical protein